MKTTIDVADRNEGERIKLALTDSTTRAFVTVMGALKPLTPKARTRVLSFVADSLDEMEATTPTGPTTMKEPSTPPPNGGA